MVRTIVGVLRGGASNEYDLSLKTGAAMLKHLDESRFDTRDILIDKKGLWHFRGFPVSPAKALTQIDVALNAVHGGAGEDGTIARLLSRSGVPYVGSSPQAYSISYDKMRAKERLLEAGILTPRGKYFTSDIFGTTADMAHAVFSEFAPPYVVKPSRAGASHGVVIVRSLPELPNAIADTLDTFGTAIVEELIAGEEVTVAVVPQFRNEALYALPPAHIIKPTGQTTFEPSTDAAYRYVVPSAFSYAQKKELETAAKRAHEALGMGHFSRADIILAPTGMYVLELNATPGLHEHAALPHMLESIGSSVSEFLDHSIQLAQRKI